MEPIRTILGHIDNNDKCRGDNVYKASVTVSSSNLNDANQNSDMATKCTTKHVEKRVVSPMVGLEGLLPLNPNLSL